MPVQPFLSRLPSGCGPSQSRKKPFYVLHMGLDGLRRWWCKLTITCGVIPIASFDNPSIDAEDSYGDLGTNEKQWDV